MSQGLECPFTSLNKGYRLLLSMVERYVYSEYMLCSRLVFSEYLRQVLQAGRSVLGYLSAVGEWLFMSMLPLFMCLLPHTVNTLHSPLWLLWCCLPWTQCFSMSNWLVYHHHVMCYCCLTLLSLCSSSQCCVDFASVLFFSAAYLLLTRYANFIYLGWDAHWLISTYQLQARLQASPFDMFPCCCYSAWHGAMLSGGLAEGWWVVLGMGTKGGDSSSGHHIFMEVTRAHEKSQLLYAGCVSFTVDWLFWNLHVVTYPLDICYHKKRQDIFDNMGPLTLDSLVCMYSVPAPVGWLRGWMSATLQIQGGIRCPLQRGVCSKPK